MRSVKAALTTPGANKNGLGMIKSKVKNYFSGKAFTQPYLNPLLDGLHGLFCEPDKEDFPLLGTLIDEVPSILVKLVRPSQTSDLVACRIVIGNLILLAVECDAMVSDGYSKLALSMSANANEAAALYDAQDRKILVAQNAQLGCEVLWLDVNAMPMFTGPQYSPPPGKAPRCHH